MSIWGELIGIVTGLGREMYAWTRFHLCVASKPWRIRRGWGLSPRNQLPCGAESSANIGDILQLFARFMAVWGPLATKIRSG